MKMNKKRKHKKLPLVNYICPRCNYIRLYSMKEALFYLVLIGIISFFMVEGMVYQGLKFQHGSDFATNAIANKVLNDKFNAFAENYTDELRELALNYTTADGSGRFDFAFELMTNMPRIRYVLPSQYKLLEDPLSTFQLGGDCKNSAILFTGMMLSVGHTAFVDCNIGSKHCVTMIPQDDKYMIIDLTSDEIFIYKNNIDYWETPGKFEEMWNFDKKGTGHVTHMTQKHIEI